MTRPTRLRVEHLDEPLGIDVRKPRLSWLLPEGSRRQLAYQIRAGGWDSGRVASDQSVLVPYEGPPLAAGQRVTWVVKVWTDAGESAWSEPASWEMGLLDPADWVARWIEPPETDAVRTRTARPAYLMRGSFTAEAPVARARLYATAHGIYELFLNGRRVGDMELTPGFTSYWSNLQVQTFDVGELLVPGENVLGAVLSDGWFRGQTGGTRWAQVYGDRVALLAQLHLHGADGSLTRVATGADWTTATGPVVAADLIQGQTVDFRRQSAGWCTPGATPGGWSRVALGDYDLTRLRSSPAPPVRRVEELKPAAVTRRSSDRQIVDLGQNINGWVRLAELGPAGTTVTLTHGEALDADGDVTLDNLVLDPDMPALETVDTSNLGLPLQVDQVTSAGRGGEAFEPRHTTHGFRYVQIEGHPDTVTVDDVTGVVVHTDLRRTGWFECSDERVNRLHEATVWTLRGNVCDIPTDCPTRERSGWTGDWALFLPAAAFLYDVAGFSAKWLRDVAADQRADGCVQHIAPDTLPDDIKAVLPAGSAGWGDGAVIVPWELYRTYGDRRVLDELWPSMAAWVDYAARRAREHRHPRRVAARPIPAPHEEFVWDIGFHFGEWLAPGDGPPPGDPDFEATTEHGELATAYLHHSSRLLAEIAAVLGRDDDAARYRELAASTKAAWQAEFMRPDGTVTCATQAAYVRALAFDLVPPELRAAAGRGLVELVRAAGTHVGTGTLATPHLLPVLADTGHVDVAYELLLQTSQPSWLAMLERGATTIWESWDADDDGVPYGRSLNHYAFGAVISFLHRYVAGIRPLADSLAYRRFRIAPMPGGGLTSARAAYDSPYGTIEAAWRRDGDAFELAVVVPPGTAAEIRLPDGQRFEAQPGSATYRGTVAPVQDHA